ncbi:MAG TPA: tetratricopeptide repeat protein [Candidatus Paceibacterota bacterium]|nr:tetratricopeptide repeat protein [Candidatus Paceibacterota bacterium]
MDTAPVSRKFSFDTAAVWALALTFGLALIAFIPGTAIPFVYTKVSILAVGAIITLALFILARLTRGNIIVPPVLLLGSLWLVPLAYLLSALFSGEGVHTAFFGSAFESDTFGFVVICSLLGSLAALVLRRREQLRLFFLLVAAAFGIVLIGEVFFLIAGQVAPNSFSASANLVGAFVDLGMLLGLALTVGLLALRFTALPRRMRAALYVAGAIELLVLALVNSVTIWVLIALVALGIFIEAIMRRTMAAADDDLEGVAVVEAPAALDTVQGSLVAPLIVLVVSIFFLIGGSTIGNALTGALRAGSLDVRPSWTSTFQVGSHTFASSPLFGTGPNTFGTDWLKYRDASLNSTIFWNIDFTSGIGYVPTSFVTTGAVGVIAWIAFLALILYLGIRFLLLRAPTDPFLRFVSLSSFIATVYLFALAVLTVPGPLTLALAFIATGVFVSSMRYGTAAQEWGVAFARSPRIGFVIVFALTLLLLAAVFGVYVVVERYLGEVAYAKAAVALQGGDLETASADIARSILFAPSDYGYRLSSSVGVARMNQVANDSTLTTDQARTNFQAALASSVSDALTATQLGPNNYQNWGALGDVYAAVVPLGIDGAYDNAKSAYEHAESLNPTNPVLPFALAQLEIANKNNTAAEADLTQAISLKHDYTQAIFLLSQLEVQEGKAQEALQAAEAAAYFAPTDPTVLFQVGLLRLGTGNTDGAVEALQAAIKVNPQYANAHFFLAVAYAAKKEYTDAITELETVSSLSPDNAVAVAADIMALKEGKNPFPATTLSEAPVSEPAATGTSPAATPAQ